MCRIVHIASMKHAMHRGMIYIAVRQNCVTLLQELHGSKSLMHRDAFYLLCK